MRNKASLILMEQLVMVLVFALAAAVCLGVFVKADGISRETALRDRAVMMAQNGAEVMKRCSGDLETAAKILNGTADETTITVQDGKLTMKIEKTASEVPGLGLAEVRVWGGNTILFTITVGWQEVAP